MIDVMTAEFECTKWTEQDENPTVFKHQTLSLLAQFIWTYIQKIAETSELTPQIISGLGRHI